MITRRSMLLTPAAAVLGCGRRKGTGFEGYAFVANEEGQAVAAVDLTAFAVARHIRMEGRPQQVLADSVRPAVYVLTPESGTVHEISTGTLALRRRAQVARAAHSMRLAGDNSCLWVLARQPRQLVRLRLNTFRPDMSIALRGEPADFDLTPMDTAPKWAAITLADSTRMMIVELPSGVSHSFDSGKKLSRARFRFDGRQLLAGSSDEPLLSLYDMPGGRLIVRLPLAVRPDCFCFKADGGQLFITGEGMDAVAIVYPYNTEVAETVLAGRAPGFMAGVTADDSDYLFVANPRSGEVTVLDVESHRAISTVAVGRNPAYIAITPDRQYALVLNRDSGDVAVIRVGMVTAKRTRDLAPLFTMIPVGSRPVSAAVRGV